jgi:hypothetical protein
MHSEDIYEGLNLSETISDEDVQAIRRQAVLDAAKWLEKGAPVAAKWLREDYNP